MPAHMKIAVEEEKEKKIRTESWPANELAERLARNMG